MTIRTAAVAATLLLPQSPSVLAQGASDALPSAGERITLPSSHLGAARTLWVWTPPGYSRARPGLPVMYVLDPAVHYRHATAVAQFLGFYLRAPEMIVVGVVSPDRNADFTPPLVSAADHRFLRFMVDEVQPHIRAAYNTAPFSILVGHSLGGLFALQAGLARPTAFNAIIAVSPSLYWSDSLVLKAARERLTHQGTLPKFVYLAHAETESPAIAASTRALNDAFATADPQGVRWTFSTVSGENHQTAMYPALHGAMRWLFADWLQPVSYDRIIAERSLAAFDEYMQRLSATYGYPVQPSELLISILGDRLYQRRAWNEAILLFARRVALYPESPEAHDELARGFLAAGRRAEADSSFTRAVALARAQRHPSLAAIEARLERLRGGR